MKPKIVVVIPTIRESQYQSFVKAWELLFIKHEVTLITVWDDETPRVEVYNYNTDDVPTLDYHQTLYQTHKSLIYRYTDACRNLGFIVAAHLNPDYVLTLDDDVSPDISECNISGKHDMAYMLTKDINDNDPIQSHLDVLSKKVPLGWMNTAHDTELYLRGVPYGIRDEAPVMLSHGVWIGTPDFDGETQLKLECTTTKDNPCKICGNDGSTKVFKGGLGSCEFCSKGQVPYSLPYYVGPIPRGVLSPLCGMNVMVRKAALPYLYFAPMGPDTKINEVCPRCRGNGRVEMLEHCSQCKGLSVVPSLNRFSDIWMGVALKKEFDSLGWACYTGGSTILHTRASNAKKNFEQEKLGREWNEKISGYFDQPGYDSSLPKGMYNYMITYQEKREKFKELIEGILKGE